MHIGLLVGAFVCLVIAAVLLVVTRGSDQPSAVAAPTGAATLSPTVGPATSAPPAASTPAATPAAPPAAVAGAGVTVDPATQAAVRAFFALAPKPVTGHPVTVPEFNASCTVSHQGSDDPIVFPGLAGASHNHTFIGNKTTDAHSTAESLRAGNTTLAARVRNCLDQGVKCNSAGGF